MEENKIEPIKEKRGILFYIGIILIIVALILILRGYYINLGYREDWLCSRWDAYSQQDYNNGNTCILEKCKPIKVKEINARVEECTCIKNNETIWKICSEEIKHRNYNFQMKKTREENKNEDNIWINNNSSSSSVNNS